MNRQAPQSSGQGQSLLGEKMSAEQIAAHSARGWIPVLLAKVAMHSTQFITLVVMARLLAPADFGVLTMVMSVIGIAGIFQDLGLSAATVREPDLRHSQVNTLFWINVGLGACMTLAGCAAAPLLRSFYSDPRVEYVAMALSFKFIIASAGAQQFALLRRNLRFKDLASISVASTAVSNLFALALAWYGAHYWALVASSLISAVYSTTQSWRLAGWRPTRPSFDPDAWRMLSFGSYLVIFVVMRYAGTNLQNVLLGRLWSSATVGHFSRGFQLLAMMEGYVVDPIDLTARTAMSKMVADTEEFRAFYLRNLASLCALGAPIGFCCMVLSGDLITVLLGPNWGSSAQVLQIMGYGVIPQMLCVSTGWIFVARGDSMRMMRWGVIGWGFLIGCLVLGAPYGLPGVAWAYTLSTWLLLVPCLQYSFRGTGLKLAQVWTNCAPIVGAGLAAWVALVAISAMLAQVHVVLRLLIGGLSYCAIYAVLLAGPFRQRHLLQGIIGLIRRQSEAAP